jgi:hypothetical protein
MKNGAVIKSHVMIVFLFSILNVPFVSHIKTNNKLSGLSPLAIIPTERQPLIGEGRANFCG